MFPITMPYMPSEKPMQVACIYRCIDFLTDRKNGDFDTVGVFYVIQPNGEKVDINRYFKESETGWDEIGFEEYNERYNVKIERE